VILIDPEKDLKSSKQSQPMSREANPIAAFNLRQNARALQQPAATK
jgi:hypothetical protein